MPALEVRDLRKVYGDTVAVDGISFDVDAGEIFGMVGPNGAGKTTTVECAEGLLRPTAGDVRVLGLEPLRDHWTLVERIGAQLQESALPPRLRVGEALALFASFYGRSADILELIELTGLTAKQTTAFAQLSGGQKQRLFIALALINDPELVFFDELTTGLDPQARHGMWDLVGRIRERGCTVLLTTHYMEEAEHLCDRVMIVDEGRIVALDTPARLIASLGENQRIVLNVPTGVALPSLEELPAVTSIERSNGRVVVRGRGDRLVGSVIGALDAAGVAATDVRTEQPNLEDVFLALTGREMER